VLGERLVEPELHAWYPPLNFLTIRLGRKLVRPACGCDSIKARPLRLTGRP
jgi:hypothetical protein